MSEPPEQEEQEPAADADLTGLLEQFREPEETRKQRANPLWMISAILLSVLGVWLALRASGGESEDKSKSAALAGAILPGKTSQRLPRGEETVDVVEDYLARCKKGMTAQEVRWIVEDFQRAGLDAEISTAKPEEFATRRRAQHSWYLDLLADGLVLTNDQRLAASKELDALLSQALERFGDELEEKASEVIEHNGKSFRVIDVGVINRLIFAEGWLADERYAPWELCELTEEQLRLTWFEWVDASRNAEPGSAMLDPEKPWWNPETSSMIDPLSGAGSISDYPTGEAPDKIDGAGSIFPFAKSQRFKSPDHDWAGPVDLQAMRCHPAQLKTSLLVSPGLAAQLSEKLDLLEK